MDQIYSTIELAAVVHKRLSFNRRVANSLPGICGPASRKALQLELGEAQWRLVATKVQRHHEPLYGPVWPSRANRPGTQQCGRHAK